jgi:glycosyltransferase involved in cell wall biosynthesis
MPSIWASLDFCLVHLKPSPLFATVMPSKIFEAMGMGVPILIGVKGEATDIVLDSGSGVAVEPGDEEDIIRKIDALLKAPETASALRQKEPPYLASRFNRDTIAREYAGTLSDITRNSIATN